MNPFACFKIDQKGQTSVEYIMLVGVMAVLAFSIMGQLRAWMVDENADCNQNPDALVCTVSEHLPQRGYGNYRYFRFR